MKKIAVVIPTFNRREYLKKVLNCLKAQKLEGIYLKVIVVVDGSTDGTLEMLKIEFPQVHIVNGTGNWWFTKCLNEGIKYAEKFNPDFILTMNDDGTIEEYFISTLYSDYLSLQNPGLIGVITVIKSNPFRVTFSGNKDFIKWRAKLVPYIDNRKEININTLSGIHLTYSLMTRGLLIPWEIGRAVNFFDEKSFPQYGSDDDFVLRVIKKGFGAYVSYNAKIFDEPLLSSKGSAITRPQFKEFIKSFFDTYTINSISKTVKFQFRHGNKLLIPLSFIYFILGTFKAYLWKYRKTNI